MAWVVHPPQASCIPPPPHQATRSASAAPQRSGAPPPSGPPSAAHHSTPPLSPPHPTKQTGDQLGQGGFAEVRRATLRDPTLPGFEEAVAVKALRADVLRSPAELREFLAEANLLRKMAHA